MVGSLGLVNRPEHCIRGVPIVRGRLAASESVCDTGMAALECPEIDVSLQELETAVSRLPADELNAFARWFEEYLADEWDRRIEADIMAGRLDEAGRKADADFEAGLVEPR